MHCRALKSVAPPHRGTACLPSLLMSSVIPSMSSSSRRCSSSSSSSSSSYRSSACYRASTSYRSEGSARGSGGLRGALGDSGDSLKPLLEPFMDPAGPHHHHHHSLFGEEGPTGSLCLSPFSPYGRASSSSYTHSGPGGGAVGAVCSSGDSYYMSADVSHFLPHHVVVLAYNHCVVIHAEKVLDDGSVSDTFTHKSLLPEDMDPLSVSGRFGSDGVLEVSVRRRGTPPGGDRGPGGS